MEAAKTVNKLNRFKNDRRGIIAALAIGIPLIICTAILWIVGMLGVSKFWDAILPNMPSNQHGIMTMMNNVAGWFVLIEIIGVIIWIYASAYKREIVDVPI